MSLDTYSLDLSAVKFDLIGLYSNMISNITLE